MTDDRRNGERRQAVRRKGEKLPYLPLYVDEFDASPYVQRLTYEGQGIYLALIRHQWRDGSIPGTEDAVRDLLGLAPDEYPRLSYMLDKQFPLRGKRRINVKLASLRRRAAAKCKQARKSALVGWQSRRNANALQTQSNRNAMKLKDNTTNTGSADALYDGDRDGPAMAALQAEVWGDGRKRGSRGR